MEAALQEQQIAVTMISNNNYMGAREKLTEAANYFPGGLENIVEMIRVCDILRTSTDFKFSGCGTDWYWVLQTKATADESHIEFKYKSLISLLEPIKDKFPGTETALELVKNAYFVLSDRERRSEFDLQRAASWGSYGSPELPEHLYPGREASSQSCSGSKRIGSECSDASNGVENCFGCRASSIKASSSKAPNLDFYDFGKNRKKAEVFAVGQIWAAYDLENIPRIYARIDSTENSPFELYVTWLRPAPVNADERTWYEVGLPVSCGYFKLDNKKSNMVVGSVFSHMVGPVTPVHGSTNEPVEIYPRKGEVWAVYRDWQPLSWCIDPETRKGCKLQLVEILTDYSKDIGVSVVKLQKVAGFGSIFRICKDKGSESLPSCQISAANLFIFSHNVPSYRFTGGELDSVSDGMLELELDPSAVPENVLVDTVTAVPPSIIEVSSSSSSSDDDSGSMHLITSETNTTGLKPEGLSHEDLTSGQIWAIYDGPDSMPRRYCMVNNVISSGSEVSVTVTYLEPHDDTMLEDEIHWGFFPSVFGLFRTGSTVVNLGVSRFSHLVKFKESTDTNFHRIYPPRKGEVWAMYKNRNTKWTLSDFSSCQYYIVEIVSDFSPVRVTNLVAVKGQMTFFQRQLDNGFELIREISKQEMFSFSHRIPAFVVLELESHGIPEGSWHLEPDALPPVISN